MKSEGKLSVKFTKMRNLFLTVVEAVVAPPAATPD